MRKYIVALADEEYISGYIEIACTQKHFQRLVNEYKSTDPGGYTFEGLKKYLKGKVEYKQIKVTNVYY